MTRGVGGKAGFTVLAAFVLFSIALASPPQRHPEVRSDPTAAPPPLDMPLIKGLSPLAARQGQQILIGGVNFGSNPTVSFSGAATAGDVYLPGLGILIVTVPAAASSGPLVVNNTSTAMASNAADFEKLGGVFTPACTIGGNVTDESTQDVSGALVVAINANEEFTGVSATDAMGDYSIAIETAGIYFVGVLPPTGTPYYDTFYSVSCPGSQDHQFSPGIELFGRVVSVPPTVPIANAEVSVESVAPGGGYEGEVLTDAGGNFGLFVPPDTFEVRVEAPIGSRYISSTIGVFDSTIDSDLGDIVLSSGVIVSGELRYRDGLEAGPLSDTWVGGFDETAFSVGSTTSIADGSFHLAAPPNSILLLAVDPDGLEPLTVYRLELAAADVQLEFPVDLFSSAAQLPELPTISEADRLNVQPGRRVVFEIAHALGAAVDVRFSDGAGGWVDGSNTYSDPGRPWLVTTVPALAETGDVVLRVDGTDGPGYPLQVDVGTFDPGPNTTSGVVSDDDGPLGGVLVGVLEAGSHDSEILIDYDITDGTGAYSVSHGTQARFLVFVPPLGSGRLSVDEFIPESTGDLARNVRLLPGTELSGSCVGSGAGPVGSTEPIPDCSVEANWFTVSEEYEEDVLTGGVGQFAMPLLPGESGLIVHAPFQSRYLDAPERVVTVGGATDAGATELDSGYFVYGRVVDPGGAPLSGVGVNVFDNAGNFLGRSQTVKDGYYRVAVPLSVSYSFSFRAHRDQDYFIPPVFVRGVFADTLLYPPAQAEIVGHVQGTVWDESMTTRLVGIPVSVWHDIYGPADWTDTLPDGTYDLRAPTGDLTVHARPTDDDLCLADETYPGDHAGCPAQILSMTAPAVVSGLDFQLGPAGALAGVVRDDLGFALGDVTVCAESGDSLSYCFYLCTTTEPDGSYVLSGIPVESDYRISISGPTQPVECWDGHEGCSGYDPVAIAECDHAPIDFWCGLSLEGKGPTSVYFRAPFDVVTGFLSELHTDRGFDRAVCLGEFPTSPAPDTLPAPAAGDGRYYLARSSNSSCPPDYGSPGVPPVCP